MPVAAMLSDRNMGASVGHIKQLECQARSPRIRPDLRLNRAVSEARDESGVGSLSVGVSVLARAYCVAPAAPRSVDPSLLAASLVSLASPASPASGTIRSSHAPLLQP